MIYVIFGNAENFKNKISPSMKNEKSFEIFWIILFWKLSLQN
jgi:hypothetical protein